MREHSRTMHGDIAVRAARDDDRAAIEERLRESWRSTTIVSRGKSRDASRLPALLAVRGDDIVGLATFEVEGGECELVSIEAFHRQQGIGSALLMQVAHEARKRGCRRLWLITTNDNVDALRFYQRRGMRLVAVHRGAVDQARRIKPAISLAGDYGIPIHDELELELRLDHDSGQPRCKDQGA